MKRLEQIVVRDFQFSVTQVAFYLRSVLFSLQVLVADGFEFHIPRGYIYFAMAFAGAVEAFNVMAKRNRRRRPRTLTA